jgi:hypothetical protein
MYAYSTTRPHRPPLRCRDVLLLLSSRLSSDFSWTDERLRFPLPTLGVACTEYSYNVGKVAVVTSGQADHFKHSDESPVRRGRRHTVLLHWILYLDKYSLSPWTYLLTGER